MASAADVREIMGMAPQDNTVTKDSIIGKKKDKKKESGQFQRPEGMHRELYNLLYSENKELPCPLIQVSCSCSRLSLPIRPPSLVSYSSHEQDQSIYHASL